ncbi:Bys1 family protein [Aspergillus lucknowensis]|uniref:Bys1 family protein n=1 Tax=Aspergillus lucknowensis TaxID=176173 RepID=A0ABR4M0T4_9EURO
MHFNLAGFLFISAALAAPFAIGAHHPAKTVNMKPTMALNETTLGHAVVSNHCQLPLYLWSVGENISPQNVVQPGQNYSEVFRHDPKTGGVAIKITTVMDGLYTSAPQTVFAYNLVDNVVWYDLSDVFGDPFMGEFVSLLPSEPAIRWKEGVPPSGSQVRISEAMVDLVLTAC